jgi:hypothetical protein
VKLRFAGSVDSRVIAAILKKVVSGTNQDPNVLEVLDGNDRDVAYLKSIGYNVLKVE